VISRINIINITGVPVWEEWEDLVEVKYFINILQILSEALAEELVSRMADLKTFGRI